MFEYIYIHTITFTLLKYTIQCFLVYVHNLSCVTIIAIFSLTFYWPQERRPPPCHRKCSQFLQTLQAWALGVLGVLVVAGQVGLVPITLEGHWIVVGRGPVDHSGYW